MNPLTSPPAKAHALGLSWVALRRHTAAELTGNVARALTGLKTRGGTLRTDRIRRCGTLWPAATEGRRVVVRHQWCRDRGCPACARRRANDYAADLSVMLGSGRWAWVTLTRPKRPWNEEGAGEATTAILEGWRALVSARKTSEPWKRIADGAVRAVEVTWSGRSGYYGWHAHVHALVRLRDGVSIQQARHAIKKAWTALVPGADQGAQHIVEADDGRARQLSKYVAKPMGLADTRALRAVFVALVGRRMIEGVGTCRAWRKAAAGQRAEPTEPDDPVCAWADCSIAKIAAAVEADEQMVVGFSRWVTAEGGRREKWVLSIGLAADYWPQIRGALDDYHAEQLRIADENLTGAWPRTRAPP